MCYIQLPKRSCKCATRTFFYRHINYLHKKPMMKLVNFKIFISAIALLQCATGMAADNAAQKAAESDIVNSTPSIDTRLDAKSENAVDELSNAAKTTIEAIDAEKDDASNAAQNNPNSAETITANTSAAPLKKPYSQLTNLAFKGKGLNGVRNYTEAANLYCRAARDGDADAQYAMGWLYSSGKGVAKDENVAVRFFSMAAKQNHISARESLIASNGNPNIAELPKCMLPDPPKPIASAALPTENPEETVTPFYIKGPIYKLVNKIAPRYKIETDLAMAFIAVESNFNPNATSVKNAQGLMQLVPETAARFKVKNSYDPEDNIKGGLAYLQWLLTYYEGDVELVAAAYNAGENTVDKFKGVPPYPETEKYVQKIAALYKKSFHPYRENRALDKARPQNLWLKSRRS
jgi:soluble lytic murein transglycosylase-like protein